MIDFFIGVMVGLMVWIGLGFIRFYLNKRKNHLVSRSRVKRDDEVFLGEYPEIPLNKVKKKDYEKGKQII